MPASESKVIVRSPVRANWLVLAALLVSLVIDLVPRFHLGDSEAYFVTRWGGYLPPDRSWTYGLILGWATRATGQLLAMPLSQIFLSWAAFAFFAIAMTKVIGLRRQMALVIVVVGCLEPLGYYWSRAFMSDSLAQSAFVFLCGVLLLQCRLSLRFILVFIAGFVLISLRVVYFPAVLLAMLAATAWSAWNERKPASGLEAGVNPTPGFRSARSWGVAAAAFLCANLTYAVANTYVAHAHSLTTNISDTEFLAATLSPAGADLLDYTPLTAAERSELVPLTYENRLASLFSPKGLVPLILGHYKSAEAARPALQRFVVNVGLHHPVKLAALVARQWGDYLNPVLVWSYQRKGWWSGAVAYGQSNTLTEADIQMFSDWKVWPIPTTDLPARISPSLWYYKHVGGIWSLVLALCATLSIPAAFLVVQRYRGEFVIFSSVFSFLYMGEVSISSVDLLTRFLMPLSVSMIFMVFVLIHFFVRAPAEKAYEVTVASVLVRWRKLLPNNA